MHSKTIRPARYRPKTVPVDAIQLPDVPAPVGDPQVDWRAISHEAIDSWDAVAVFLGLDPNSGRGEHATMRRPSRGRAESGYLLVTIHQRPGRGFEAGATDWIIKDELGVFSVLDDRAFRAFYEPEPACFCTEEQRKYEHCGACDAHVGPVDEIGSTCPSCGEPI